MKPIHTVATALVAIFGLALAAPAEAAPKGDPAAASWAGHVMQVNHDDDDDDGGRRWRHRDRDDDWRWRRDRRGEWRDHRDRRGDWRDHRGRRFDWDRDRGRHFGRDRGPDRRWWDDRWKKKHWAKQHKRWRHHPRHRHWVGRRFPRVKYVVIRDYHDYHLPPPYRGHFYARIDNDVFLVAEATKRIIDAFVLLDATGR